VLGALSFSATFMEKFSTGSDFCSWLLARQICLSSINFRDINGFSKLGTRTLIRDHREGSKVVPFYGSFIVSEAVSCTVYEV